MQFLFYIRICNINRVHIGSGSEASRTVDNDMAVEETGFQGAEFKDRVKCKKNSRLLVVTQ